MHSFHIQQAQIHQSSKQQQKKDKRACNLCRTPHREVALATYSLQMLHSIITDPQAKWSVLLIYLEGANMKRDHLIHLLEQACHLNVRFAWLVLGVKIREKQHSTVTVMDACCRILP